MKILDSIKKNTIILLLITIVVLYFVLRNDWNGIVQSLQNINIWYIFLAIICYLLYVVMRGYINFKIINDPKTVSLSEAIKQHFIAQFFNGITPFSTGGQPMEIFMLKECGLSIAKATNVTVQSFIFYQIALVICGLVAVTYNFIFHLFPKLKLLQYLVLLGFIINIIVVILLLLSYSKAFTKKLEGIAIKVLKKLKVKRSEEEIKQKFEDYHNSFQELKRNKKLVIAGILLNIVSLLILYVIPLLVFLSLGDIHSLTIMKTIVSSAYVYLIGAFVPIPGASGGIEYGYTQFFGNFAGAGFVSATVLIWRTITYYFAIIIGAIVFNIRKKEKVE